MMQWQTVTGTLKKALIQFMEEPLFQPFRLIGGTALSLQLGHRVSIDIDLFTDADYGSIDFGAIDRYLRKEFRYVFPAALPGIISLGQSYIIGDSEEDSIKLDVYYTTDPFMWDIIVLENIRIASMEEIAAMKMNVVQRGGRKKDFWDIHELKNVFSIDQMIKFHERRYPYDHDENMIRRNLVDFSSADENFDPECLKGKAWEIIKLDLLEALNES